MIVTNAVVYFELLYFPSDRLPWVLKAHKKTSPGPSELIRVWCFRTEQDATDMIEIYRHTPIVRFYQ